MTAGEFETPGTINRKGGHARGMYHRAESESR